MVNRILVPLDGSKLSEGVLPFVEALAGQLRAVLYLVEVVAAESEAWPKAEEPPHPVSGQSEWEARGIQAAVGYLSGMATALQARNIDARWEVVEGAAATSIINFAHSHAIDLIAMSTHGRSGLSRMVFGSVADQVMREASIPVLMVRPGHEEA